MTDCEQFCLEKSTLTIALKKDFCFISSYPGFFIFGCVDKNHYKKNKFFQFSHFELPQLYSAILKIINFMAGETENIDKTEVLKKQIEDSNVDYYIVGNISADKKIIKFLLEANLQTFDFSMTVFELHDFIYCLSDIVLSCLCLNTIEREMINNAILEPLEKIINFQNITFAKQYIKNILDKTTCSTIIENLSIILVHYNYVVIILHKFKNLRSQQTTAEKITSDNQYIINQM